MLIRVLVKLLNNSGLMVSWRQLSQSHLKNKSKILGVLVQQCVEWRIWKLNVFTFHKKSKLRFCSCGGWMFYWMAHSSPKIPKQFLCWFGHSNVRETHLTMSTFKPSKATRVLTLKLWRLWAWLGKLLTMTIMLTPVTMCLIPFPFALKGLSDGTSTS